jgi:hypothetical protein
MSNTLPTWRQACNPHHDIREDAVSEALFAVNLSRAIADEGAEEYRDPTLFFQRTHLTRTLKSLILDVLRTLQGDRGAAAAPTSVIHLQTNFGGGKTHAELALYHLLTSPQHALAVDHMASFLADNGFERVPGAAIAALPCADLDAGGREVDGLEIRTLWGEMAYRLGGLSLYEMIRESDHRRGAPGVVKLRELLTAAGPNVLLIDELLHYVDKAAAVSVGDSNLATQTLAFLRELTEAVDAVDHSILIASLTMSKVEDLQVLSEDEAEFTLTKLEDILRRLEDTRTPIESTEIYDIVRTRLFQNVDEEAAAQTAAAYAGFYRDEPWRDLLPQASRESGFEDLLRKAYPFHPSIVKVLYERWGSRPQFQLTRGTLRFLSHLLASLWQKTNGHADGPLIQLSDVDLSDEDVRAEVVRVAGSAWEAVIGTDIATTASGQPALARRVDKERGGLYARLGLVQGLATSVFMFTHGGQQRRPTPQAEVRLAVTRPVLPLSDLNQAFDDARARLYYYYDEEGGLIFKTEPNPNKVLADERANINTDQARRQVEEVVPDVVGTSQLFNVVYYDFHNKLAKEPGDVPDDDTLQLVVLPPHLTLARGKAVGRTAQVINDVATTYGKRHRMGRNLVCFMAPSSDLIAAAIDRAVDWLAAHRVSTDDDLMERFSESQRQVIDDRVKEAENGTKDFVRKAYNVVLLPSGEERREAFELSYVPPSKTVLEQAEDELLQARKIHRQFNPALLDGRWSALWPKTATVITTETLWQKFARRGEVPVLAGPYVLKAMIKQGVEQSLFGYGVLVDDRKGKLQAASYERVFFGAFDAEALPAVEIGARGVLLRPAQVDALFPPMTQDEIAMVLDGPRQSVATVFKAARTSPMVEGRVDQASFFAAVVEGVTHGLFGYAETAEGTVLRGPEADLAADEVRFSGWLIGEDVPIPVTVEEIVRLLPAEGRIRVEDLYAQAVSQYGDARVTAERLLDLLKRSAREHSLGYAATVEAAIEPGIRVAALEGYVGRAEAVAPDARVIRVHGDVSSTDLANVIKTVMAVSRLSEDVSITLDLRLALAGEVKNEHSLQTALRELQQRVGGVAVEDSEP